MQYSTLSLFLPFIENNQQFQPMRHEIMSQLTPRQSQAQMTAATANIDNDQTDDDIIKIESKSSATKTPTTTKTEKEPINYANKLFIHYRHEKRLHSMKRDMHQLYDNVYRNIPAMDVKLIVGHRDRADAKKNLYEKDQNEQYYKTY